VLAGKLKPNLGQFDDPPDWEDILKRYRGSELQNYFARILEEKMKAVIKPQYVDHLPRAVKGRVEDIIARKDKLGVKDHIMDVLDLQHLKEREIAVLSGGELQRFAIGVVAVQQANVYMFDEPSSYLDIRQRMRAAQVIRGMLETGDSKYVICVEHDLSVLDYLSDFICCLYGVPGAYGVVTMPFSVREGINIFLAGFVPTENLRFREDALTFKIAQTVDDSGAGGATRGSTVYPTMTKTLESAKKDSRFELTVEAGSFGTSQIVVMLGENGMGKTTFIRMLAGLMKPDDESVELDGFAVSYKPQKIAPKFDGPVRYLLQKKVGKAMAHPQFQTDVIKNMSLDSIIDQDVKHLSGGELQRVALVLCLGKPADVYLIDEPSAYLDSEQRIMAAKVIKRYILHAKKTAFIVEHDFIMATYLADQVIVYEGSPGRVATAHSPQGLLSGMNTFLAMLGITFRRDPTNYRPRINKLDSVKDSEQKKAGTYFYMDE
jgi:ATP-binding cassette subfamily E protein 1